MSNLINIKNSELPKDFLDINPHNLYLYCKSYAASLRANTAHTKNRSDVRGGGKKPWAQKGGGRARAGSKRSPIFVGGGVTFGPTSNKNYSQKVNKKQKKLALKYALSEHAKNSSLMIMDEIKINSGKTKDGKIFFDNLNQRDCLIIKSSVDINTQFALQNLKNIYLITQKEINAYLVTAYHSILIEKSVWKEIKKS